MITFTVSAFVTFLTIIDPVGLAPVIIGLTAHLNDIQRTILYVNLATVSGNPLSLLTVGAAIVSALFAAWLVMRSSQWIIHLIGRTGTLVLSRILGILLAALAIQFVLNGILEFIQASKLAK